MEASGCARKFGMSDVENPLGPTDWFYRNWVSKDPWDNVEFREWCLEKAYASDAFADELWVICSRDLLFYVNTFGWLLEPRKKGRWQKAERPFGEAREIPFITRPYQDTFLLGAQEALGNEDAASLKSRETGATWMMLYLFDWQWRFYEQSLLGLMSKDEDSVDDPDDPDSLMAKLDFIHEHLPFFLRPKRDRSVTHHTIVNVENNSVISGYACTGNVARGGRKMAFLGDECHSWPVDVDYAALDSLQHVTPSRFFISTPNRDRGQTGAFYDMINQPDAQMRRLDLDWKMDREKSAGLYSSRDGELEIIDQFYEFGAGYRFILDGKIRSPYYDYECSRPGATPQSIAAELDKDFGGATNRFVDPVAIMRARQTCRKPNYRARLFTAYPGQWSREIRLDENGDLWLWTPEVVGFKLRWTPDPDDPSKKIGRLVIPADREFVAGADIAQGIAGAFSSYSALEIFDRLTGEQVLEWRGNRLQPHEFAAFSAVVCYTFNTALLNPEVTGLGNIFLANVLSPHSAAYYTNLWFRPSATDSPAAVTSKRVGYDNKDGGKILLQELERAIKLGLVTIRSDHIPTELERYFVDGQTGKLRHPLVGRGRQNAPEQSHGDCAIAASVAWFAMHEDPEPEEKQAQQEAPEDSFAARTRLSERTKRANSNPPWWSPFPTDEETAPYLRAG